MSTRRPQRQTVFICYSRKDKKWLEALQTHLGVLVTKHQVDVWDDTRIQPGQRWEDEIRSALEQAQVAVLLISPTFLVSDYITSKELPAILKAERDQELIILPVVVQHCALKLYPELAQFETVNPIGSPIAGMMAAKRNKVWADIALAVLEALERQETVTTKVGAEEASRFSLPPRPGRFYVTRERVLEETRKALERNGRAALWGIGGAGKTLAATEYAYAEFSRYSAAFWVRAASREDLNADFADIARKLDLPLKDEREQDVVVRAARRWLEENDDWLLVLDNVDDLGLAAEFVPSRGGHVLLTTQDRATGELAEPIEVESLTAEEGARLLLMRARKLKTGESLDVAAHADSSTALALAGELGGLPLALDQAGAFIEEAEVTPGEYLRLYRKQTADLLAARGGHGDDHPSVLVTFKLAFGNVQKASPAAADLLRLCALMAPDAIPEAILTEGADVLGPDLGSEMHEDFRRLRVYRFCRRYSLLRRNPEARSLSVHRVVQHVVRSLMRDSEQRSWANRTVSALSRAMPWHDYDNLSPRWTLLSQGIQGACLIDEFQIQTESAADLLGKMSRLFDDLGQYDSALKYAYSALRVAQSVFPSGHRSLARFFESVGVSEAQIGHYQDAEVFLLRAVEVAESISKYDSVLGSTLTNLAAVYQIQGRYLEAEPLQRRSLQMQESKLGLGHSDTATTMNNLAFMLLEMGRNHEAEDLLVRSQTVIDTVLGLEHPSCGIVRNTLALVRCDQERYRDAETLLFEALATQEEKLGVEHPIVAFTLNNLGKVYRRWGRYEQGEQSIQRALRIREKALGREHPYTADVLETSGLLLHAMGRFNEAEGAFLRALGIWEKALGPTNPKSVSAREGYAALLRDMGREAEANEVAATAAEIRTRVQLPPPNE